MTAPRLPTELAPPRMDALARLPVFLALEGKRAVVAGGNAQAAWKAELFRPQGRMWRYSPKQWPRRLWASSKIRRAAP